MFVKWFLITVYIFLKWFSVFSYWENKFSPSGVIVINWKWNWIYSIVEQLRSVYRSRRLEIIHELQLRQQRPSWQKELSFRKMSSVTVILFQFIPTNGSIVAGTSLWCCRLLRRSAVVVATVSWWRGESTHLSSKDWGNCESITAVHLPTGLNGLIRSCWCSWALWRWVLWAHG